MRAAGGSSPNESDGRRPRAPASCESYHGAAAQWFSKSWVHKFSTARTGSAPTRRAAPAPQSRDSTSVRRPPDPSLTTVRHPRPLGPWPVGGGRPRAATEERPRAYLANIMGKVSETGAITFAARGFAAHHALAGRESQDLCGAQVFSELHAPPACSTWEPELICRCRRREEWRCHTNGAQKSADDSPAVSPPTSSIEPNQGRAVQPMKGIGGAREHRVGRRIPRRRGAVVSKILGSQILLRTPSSTPAVRAAAAPQS